jgi:hypothetical protein
MKSCTDINKIYSTHIREILGATIFFCLSDCWLVVSMHTEGPAIGHLSTGFALMMEAVSTSETSVSFYETTRRNIPEDKSSSGQSTVEPGTSGI